jgi:hypothetical protein
LKAKYFIYYREEYESDRIQSEEEETVQEKKIRLAKHFIDQIQQGKIKETIFR